MAELLRGAPVARALTERLIVRREALEAVGITPRLVVIRVGERADDLSYERGLLKRCEKVGIAAEVRTLAADCKPDELLACVRAVNEDASVHGCLMFRPLPAQLDEAAAAASLDPAKDVDCMTDASLLATLAGRAGGFAPCTAEAVLEVLDHYGVALEGRRVTVVGRSLVIGRPVSLMLQARNATVTMCHTKTADLAAECARADVIVAAAGHAKTVGEGCFAPGQTVIDVGINWDEKNACLVGDVDAAAAKAAGVAAITPVPGGVGAVTTAILAKHVVEAAERSAHEL